MKPRFLFGGGARLKSEFDRPPPHGIPDEPIGLIRENVWLGFCRARVRVRGDWLAKIALAAASRPVHRILGGLIYP